jgi:uncharacterized protein DUF397
VSVSEQFTDWRKSSYSGAGNDCVEIAFGSGVTGVRDSKNPDGPPLRFASAGWTALLARVKR